MYLKRHFISILKPIEIKEKLNKNIHAPIGINNYFSYHKKEAWFGLANENSFILTQTPKWYRNTIPIQIKGVIEPLPYNGGSKIRLTFTIQKKFLINLMFLCALTIFFTIIYQLPFGSLL